VVAGADDPLGPPDPDMRRKLRPAPRSNRCSVWCVTLCNIM
jgi:hypothetical protein